MRPITTTHGGIKLKTMLIVAGIAAAMLTGCVSTSEVTEIGKDTYMVGTEARGGMQTKGKAMTANVKAANAFCGEKGKKMMLTHTETSGIPGWSPVDAEIQFVCLDADDPQYRQTILRKDPTEVIQITK